MLYYIQVIHIFIAKSPYHLTVTRVCVVVYWVTYVAVGFWKNCLEYRPKCYGFDSRSPLQRKNFYIGGFMVSRVNLEILLAQREKSLKQNERLFDSSLDDDDLRYYGHECARDEEVIDFIRFLLREYC